MLTQEEARRLFDYDPETGDLKNRVTRGSNSLAIAGSKAGTDKGNGYLQVNVNKRCYLIHRLIWLWVHGYFPEHDIDHINRDRSDNRLENLREASRSCNMRNANQLSNNTSGVTGVHWHKSTGKWGVYIKVNKQQHYLGLSTDFTEAVLTRLAAEQCLNWEGCDSSSDAFKYLQEMRHDQIQSIQVQN